LSSYIVLQCLLAHIVSSFAADTFIRRWEGLYLHVEPAVAYFHLKGCNEWCTLNSLPRPAIWQLL